MTSPLRIEMLLPSLPRAGMEVMSATLARGLRARGHEIGFTCIGGPDVLGRELEHEGFRVSVIACPGLRSNLIPMELAEWLQRIRPDVAHAHTGLWLKAVQAAHQAGVPRTVFTCHGLDSAEPWHIRVLNRMAAFRTDAIVAVSQSLGEYLTKDLHISERKVTVIPNGISIRHATSSPPAAAMRRRLDIPAHAPLIGSVARFDPVKNHRLLVDAFARVKALHPSAYLLLVGDGDCRAQVEAHVASLSLGPFVRITGIVADPGPYLQVMDVFALSSDFEGTSMSILEAMAAGTPVAATAVGGTPELLAHGRTGMLSPARNAAALAENITQILSSNSLRNNLVKAAITTVRDQYSEDLMIDKYEHIYNSTGANTPRERDWSSAPCAD